MSMLDHPQAGAKTVRIIFLAELDQFLRSAIYYRRV